MLEDAKDYSKYFNEMNVGCRNMIDLIICEVAIKIFEKGRNFRNFKNWADSMRVKIDCASKCTNSTWVSNDLLDTQIELIDELVGVFGFNADEAYYLVKYFFINELYIKFESVARTNNRMFME